jgi:Lar family restriction alleviation protein
MNKILIETTLKELEKYGLVVCKCGHPPNNHFMKFEEGDKSCARCEKCKTYEPKILIGKRVSIPMDAVVILQGELLPCPFCGGIAETYKPIKGYGMYVGCNDCHASMFGIDDKNLDNSERVAINSWNKRAGREPKSK